MKEYEYINYGIENCLVDQLVGVICQENLQCRPYPDGFRRIFDKYAALRQEFKDETASREGFELPDVEYSRIMDKFGQDRSQFLEAFLIELEQNYPMLDVRQLSKDYFEQVHSENVLTTTQRVSVYPYLTFQAMQSEERELKNGTHN